MELDTEQWIKLLATAGLTLFGMFKIKFIEAIVKRVTSEIDNARGISVLILVTVFAVLTAVSIYPTAPTLVSGPIAEKSDLEVKVNAIKEGITLTQEIAKAAKENKQRKDSIYTANKSERWVYRISDWTDDEERIVELNEMLSMTQNIKLLRIKKKYLFIKEDNASRESLEESLDSLKRILNGAPVSLLNLNSLTTRKRDNLVERIESFGRRKNKARIPCLILD